MCCWVHALRNACAKAPQRLRETFKKLAHRVMYATSENAARLAFQELKAAMGTDAERAVRCLEKDLNALLTHYRFERPYWRALMSARTSSVVIVSTVRPPHASKVCAFKQR